MRRSGLSVVVVFLVAGILFLSSEWNGSLLAVATSFQEADTSAPQPRQTEFILEEYEPYGVLGTGVIEGQAFLWAEDGDLVHGAGKLVFMNPVTTYSTEWWERNVMNRIELEPSKDQRGRYYHWITIADGFGQFRFEGLPPGEYYLGSRVIEGEQFAYAKVTLADGERAEILLTHGAASGRKGKSRGPHNNPIRTRDGEVPE